MRMHARALREAPLTPARAAWLYGLLAVTDKPLIPEMATLLRELVVTVAGQRSALVRWARAREGEGGGGGGARVRRRTRRTAGSRQPTQFSSWRGGSSGRRWRANLTARARDPRRDRAHTRVAHE